MFRKIIFIVLVMHSFIFEVWAQIDESIQDIQYLFESHSLDTINTEASDFGPVWFDNSLFFSSDREHDWIKTGENRWKKNSAYNIFYATNLIDSNDFANFQVRQVKFYDKKLNSILHSGPICFSVTGDTVFVTQVNIAQKDTTIKGKLYRPFIYFSIKKKNGKYGKLIRLPFITDNYNFAHPSFHSPSRTLYFASNYLTAGDEDIFKVKWLEDGSWSKIENLGDSINTLSDEMFPYYYHKQLFFASDRENGFGGLDLYWSLKKNDKWKNARNLGSSINTEADDFSFTINENNKWAFFTSNRKGNNDIFYSKIKRNYILKDENEFFGQFVYRTLKTDAIGLKVMLTNESGIVLDETYTDSTGSFSFSRLNQDSSYLIVVKDDYTDLELRVFNNKGKKMAILISSNGEVFDYKKMKIQESDILSLLNINNSNLNSIDLDGQFLYEKLPGDYPKDLEVKIVDGEGKLLFSTNTDEYGNFLFKKLPLDKEMYLTINEDVNDDFILLIFNNKGNVVARLKNGDDGHFNFRKLRDDKINLSMISTENDSILEAPYKRLTGEVDFKKLDGYFENGLEVIVFDENSVAIDTVRTSETGSFIFERLSLDFKYLQFYITDAEAYHQDDLNFYITNRKNEKITALFKNQKHYFVYKPLGSLDENLTVKNDENTQIEYYDKVAVNDSDGFVNQDTMPKIDSVLYASILKMLENPNIIYFDVNSSYFNAKNKEKLKALLSIVKNHKGLIEVSSYADSRSTPEYNMWISENRTKRVVDFLVKNGIDPQRISKNAYGESGLKNDCGDGVECPEEMHQINRRTEIILAD